MRSEREVSLGLIYRHSKAEATPIPGLPSTEPLHSPVPPSLPNLRALFLRAIELGRVRMSRHFRDQAAARSFSTLDAEQILEEGEIILGPQYQAEHCSWKCELHAKVDGRSWKLVIGLHCAPDLIESPLINLITVHRIVSKRAKTKRG